MSEIIGIFPLIGDMDLIREKPHLPLSLIHAMTLAAKEFDVIIVDLRIEDNWKEKLNAALKKDPLFVGLSVMSGFPVGSALEVSRYIKSVSDVPTVWGGVHPTIDPEQTIRDNAVDMVVIGEGEETVLEAARRIKKKESLNGVKGLWYKDKGEIIRNELRPFVDLDALPIPPYHLVDLEKYKQEYKGRLNLNLETSRGCIFNCRYCYHTSEKNRAPFRALSVDKTLERIFWLRDNFNVDGTYLVDDNFFIDRKRGKELLMALAQEKRDFYWQIQGVDVPSILSFSNGDLDLLAKSRLDRISVGAESGSERVLRYIKKPHTVETLFAANKKISEVDVNVYYSIVSGFPTETLNDLRQTIGMMFRLLKENPHARVSPIYNFVPWPGTPLWEETIKQYGFMPPKELADWQNFDWNHVNVPYLSAEMSEVLDNLYWAGLCMDDKFADYNIPRWLYYGTKVYKPIARARLKKLFYRFPVEKIVVDLVSKMIEMQKRQKKPWTI